MIQITSRMYHVQVVFSNVILLCIIMEDCATYLKKPALLIITKGGWLGKELLRVQTKFKYNKVVNKDFTFPKKFVFDVQRPTVNRYLNNLKCILYSFYFNNILFKSHHLMSTSPIKMINLIFPLNVMQFWNAMDRNLQLPFWLCATQWTVIIKNKHVIYKTEILTLFLDTYIVKNQNVCNNESVNQH